jgi:Na+/H+ antiporter NhaD/arsenite permease-like protein
VHISRPSIGARSDTIAARRDRLGGALWILALGLGAAAVTLQWRRVGSAAVATALPFLTLAAVISAGLVGERLGIFRFLARVVIPRRAAGPLAAAAVLTFTALISGVVNLDVAVVVAIPVALQVAGRTGLSGSRLAVAAALTANAASFLLPTSNLTTLLVLSRSPLPLSTYLEGSWFAWVLVTTITVGALSIVLGRSGQVEAARPSSLSTPFPVRTLLDLIPMFVGASALRAFIGTAGIVLQGGFIRIVAAGSLLAAAVNNLPAAAAVHAAGSTATWAAVWRWHLGPTCSSPALSQA